MNYLSVCSGIEAATVAWHHMGWNPVGFSDIEKFPSAVLQHHYPDITNYGDMTKFKEWKLDAPVELIVGGTPCQSFSIAGLRKGLDDPRGNLMLTYLAMAEYFKPKWLLWENVPGVLSSNGGRDFATFLQGLAKLGYGFAYRVLDAQHFGVPQRRRRVFLVGCFGDWRSATKVLFESESLCRNITPSHETQEKIASFTPSGFGNYSEGIGTLRANGGDLGGGSEVLCVAQTLTKTDTDYKGDKSVCYGFNWQDNYAFNAHVEKTNPLRVSQTEAGAHTFKVRGGQDQHLSHKMTVRRLTPLECERLQGFPDNYTNIPKASDSLRYKALGNSMAVPVMRWIGERIDKTNTYQKEINDSSN